MKKIIIAAAILFISFSAYADVIVPWPPGKYVYFTAKEG